MLVRFYVLKSDDAFNRYLTVGRILQKALSEHGERCDVLIDNSVNKDELIDALWQAKGVAFLPADADGVVRIISQPDDCQRDTLINLTCELLENRPFKRQLFVVDQHPTTLQANRQNYRLCQQKNLNPDYLEL